MPPIKFPINPTYCLGGDVVLKDFRMAAMDALEQNEFSNSEFP